MIPKIEDMQDIAVAIRDICKNAPLDNMTIEFKVNKTAMKKLNEELYYKNSKGGKLAYSDEIVVNVGEIVFKFVLKEEEPT